MGLPKTKHVCNLGVGASGCCHSSGGQGKAGKEPLWNRRQEAEQTAAPKSAEMKRAPRSVACPGLPHSTPGNQQRDSALVKGQRRVRVSEYTRAPLTISAQLRHIPGIKSQNPKGQHSPSSQGTQIQDEHLGRPHLPAFHFHLISKVSWPGPWGRRLGDGQHPVKRVSGMGEQEVGA